MKRIPILTQKTIAGPGLLLIAIEKHFSTAWCLTQYSNGTKAIKDKKMKDVMGD